MTDTRDKPPLPAERFASWSRMEIDEAEGGDFDRIWRGATSAATGLMVSGTVKYPLSPYEIASAAVKEGLLYLLEMGLIDIDSERLNEVWFRPHPPYREGR